MKIDLDGMRSKGEEYAYKMGIDCAINGANTTNCHFSIFSSPENTRAWEKGKRDALHQNKNKGANNER